MDPTHFTATTITLGPGPHHVTCIFLFISFSKKQIQQIEKIQRGRGPERCELASVYGSVFWFYFKEMRISLPFMEYL